MVLWMTSKLRIFFSSIGLLMLLAGGCAGNDNGPGAGDIDQGLSSECKAARRSCKEECDHVSDKAERGVCFNGCLKDYKACVHQ